jgi:tetratricopeptide (TPR) repeat protein
MTMNDTDILRAELERLFELEELLTLSRGLLGFEPEAIGGTAAKASFAGALTAYCRDQDAVEALCDALLATRPDVSNQVLEIRSSGLPSDEALVAGSELAGFSELRKLGEGRLALSYVGLREQTEYRIKVLRREATRDRRGLHRFLTVTRLLSRIDHPGLPQKLTAGSDRDRTFVAHELVRGVPLSQRVARIGALHLNEVRELLESVLKALAALHEKRLAHGDLRLENVIVGEGASSGQAVLVDIGSDRLRMRPRLENGRTELFSTTGSPKSVAPEQIQGYSADARSDVYSFGAILYEVLTGRAPFAGKNALETAFSVLSEKPAAPSSVAPRGFVLPELDDFVLELLSKEPSARPADARVVLELFEQLGRRSAARRESVTTEAVAQKLAELKEKPEDEELALALEAIAADPQHASSVIEALLEQAEGLSAESALEAKKRLMTRAARLLSHEAETRPRAEEIYAKLHELAPEDELVEAALIELRRRLGKLDEVIELYLARAERAQGRAEKARALAEIGRIFANERGDRDQALVAFTQSFCENPHEATVIAEIERFAASSHDAWNEVLGNCSTAANDEAAPAEDRIAILGRAGRWSLERLQRPDMALSCFQALLALEPGNDSALAGLTQIYRKAEQWPELGTVLTTRAEAAATPAQARDFRTEAAEILDTHLSDPKNARVLYEQVLESDPTHARALSLLQKLYERSGDFKSLVELLGKNLNAERSAERQKVLTRLGEIYETKLSEPLEAARHYEMALDLAPDALDALRGLERLHESAGRFQELIDNLKRQIELSATPRQKVALLERVATLYDKEFLDPRKAAEALERVLELDPVKESAATELVRHYRQSSRWEEVASLFASRVSFAAEPAEKARLLLEQARVLAGPLGSPERARRAYEAVLALVPSEPEALEALVQLRESGGDADAALSAVETLAAQAASPEAKAEQWLRAAKLLEARGDRDGAIERFKRALDANPRDAAAATALREALVARGDVHAALQLLERELEYTEGDRAKAALAARMAVLYRDKVRDEKRAEESARRAVDWDPTSLDALRILGDVAFESGRFLEASRHYETIAERVDRLPDAARLLIRYVDSLAQTGSSEKALVVMDALLRTAPDDREALERAAQVTFEHGTPARAAELYAQLLARFGGNLDHHARARALFRRGEALRRSGQLDQAIAPLEEAADLDPSVSDPLVSLAKLFEAREAWADVIKVKHRKLESAAGEDRVQILFEIGEIAANKLNDRTRAAKSLVAALDEKPDDRRVLTKLMQLYGEDKDWSKLVAVVLRLAEFVDDPKQRVKYLHTAAIVTARQIGDPERALEFYAQVLELEPDFDRAIEESIELERSRENHAGVERLIKRRLELATTSNDQESMVKAFEGLAELYEKKLGWTDQAVDAYEAAQTLDPDNSERAEKLGRLYATDPEKYLEKAVSAEVEALRLNPLRVESYRALRRLYTETKHADSAWCLCQALTVLNLAEPDEERFYKRMRSETAAPALNPLTDDDWLLHVMHPDADTLLTSVFALIEGTVIARRGQSLEELGYEREFQLVLGEHPAPVCQSLFYGAGVLGIPLPPTYENSNDPGGISFLFADEPSFVLGVAALQRDVPLQPAAFIAAQSLTYLRPGMFLRHLLSSGTALKAWLFAAIKLTAPAFPVAPEIEGAVNEAFAALEAGAQGQVRDHLTRVVGKLLTSGTALDLKRWVAAVDLTADRAGFIAAHDLDMAVRVIRASDDAQSSVPIEERVKELVLYSVSPSYFEVRKRLGVSVDT